MRKRICFIVAKAVTARAFLKNHINALRADYDVYLAGDINAEDELGGLNLTGWHHIDIKRSISPLNDLKAIVQARSYFQNMKFDAVHSVTPKAGLITAIAARLAGIKHRTHIFTGQVWATRKGFMRTILKAIDKLIISLNNHILVDGKSQRRFLIEQGVLREGQAIVFGEGSISGVDTERFTPSATYRLDVRNELNIPEDKMVFIFLGRLNPDKGINELLSAFDRLAALRKDVYLLLVGYDEGNYTEQFHTYPYIQNGVNFCYYGSTPTPERLLSSGDVFVMPTYREGFGSSVIEAASCGLPCICSDAYGVQDAFESGITGLRCMAKDVDSLLDCMTKLADDAELRAKLGEQGRKRTIEKFRSEAITNYWLEYYHKMLS